MKHYPDPPLKSPHTLSPPLQAPVPLPPCPATQSPPVRPAMEASCPFRLQSYALESSLTREGMDLLRRKGVRIGISGSCGTGDRIIRHINVCFPGFEGDPALWKIKPLNDGNMLLLCPSTLAKISLLGWKYLNLQMGVLLFEDWDFSLRSLLDPLQLTAEIVIRGLPLEFWNELDIASITGSFATLLSIDRTSLTWCNNQDCICQVTCHGAEKIPQFIEMHVNGRMLTLKIDIRIALYCLGHPELFPTLRGDFCLQNFVDCCHSAREDAMCTDTFVDSDDADA
ncbi:hypothetical protein Cni_G10403 [Canna indica]|uniref:DUF4283 domain-containing protein n=1 Tax=Canna indica TaxID=4628 RepID=A0AAQ3Q7A7_9LILI|nr:hypothetical protein Cni_G10403 [Canna indica]